MAMRYFFSLVLLSSALSAEAGAGLSMSSAPADIAGLSGERGDIITRPEELARGKAAVGITVLYRDEIACGVALEGRAVGRNANFETRTVSRCSTGRGRDSEEAAEASWGEHLSGLSVCYSRGDQPTVTGLDLTVREVDEEGLGTAETNVRGFSLPNCDRSGSESICGEDQLLTGLVLHFSRKERRTDLPDSLTGLQAVCRDVLAE